MPRRLTRLLSAATPPPGDAVADAELLRRYATSRDAAAFELLVRRHADAVWNACSRVLRNDHDADDAFQAAFLVLAKKAGTVRGASAGAWLHRVAVNAALKLKASGRRGPAVLADREQPAHAERSPDPEDLAVVHEELARLPERYRLPVVLCDLEGHTHAEAAKVLGWPIGSVSGRLSRAHALLRDRLSRRGFAAVALPTCAAPSRVVSAVPSAVAASLAEGVLFAMRAAKLKFVAALAVGLAGVAGLGTVFAVGIAEVPRVAAVQPPPPDDDPPEKEPDPKTTPDPKWRQGRPFPSVFPDIKPLSTATLQEFQQRYVEPIFLADTPLQKLQKAKLEIILHNLAYEVRNVEDVKPDQDPKPGQPRPDRSWTDRHLESIPGLVRDATVVAGELNMKSGLRPWLVLRVAAEKRIDATYEVMKINVQGQETKRLDAEIALAKHDAKK